MGWIVEGRVVSVVGVTVGSPAEWSVVVSSWFGMKGGIANAFDAFSNHLLIIVCCVSFKIIRTMISRNH